MEVREYLHESVFFLKKKSSEIHSMFYIILNMNLNIGVFQWREVTYKSSKLAYDVGREKSSFLHQRQQK